MAAVARVDDGYGREFGGDARGTFFRMAMAQMSAKQEMTRIVSATVSPLAAEEDCASAKPRTLPPRFSMADSKESLVRVLGS